VYPSTAFVWAEGSKFLELKIIDKMDKKRSKSEIRFWKVFKSEYFESGRRIFDFGMFR